ncbi:MAG: hypothetical protein H6709_20350 [Kofleriaceae bacterium]|nr:hypothetical protein [Myxococcales bacterium]MCB9564244.1 hypothetical protein [Kofleriaceae bacterium]MCB9574433.1 hypothetical protein [Kofleriaceae bacterium]
MKPASLATILLAASVLPACILDSNDDCDPGYHLETYSSWEGSPPSAPLLLSAGGERLLVWFANDGVHAAPVDADGTIGADRVDSDGPRFAGVVVSAPDRHLVLRANQATQRTDAILLAPDGTVRARRDGVLPGVSWTTGAWTGDGFVVSGQLQSGVTHGVIARLDADGGAVGDVVETGAGNEYRGVASVVATGDVVWAVWGARVAPEDSAGNDLVGRRYTRALAPIDAEPQRLASQAAVARLVPTADGARALMIGDGATYGDVVTIVLDADGAGPVRGYDQLSYGGVVAASADPAGGWDVAFGATDVPVTFPRYGESSARVFRVRDDGAVDVVPGAEIRGSDALLVEEGQVIAAGRTDTSTGTVGQAQLDLRVYRLDGAPQLHQIAATATLELVETTSCARDEFQD